MKKSKKVTKQLTIFEDSESDELLAWFKVKRNRLRVFRYIYKNWEVVDDKNPFILVLGFKNKDWQKGNEVAKMIAGYLEVLGENTLLGWIIFKELHKLYWPRIVKYVLNKIKANGGYFPTLGATKTIQTLLDRGWVHELDINNETYNPLQEVVIYCHVAPLVWPKTYYQHSDAIKQLNKVGIPGRTGTRLPKN